MKDNSITIRIDTATKRKLEELAQKDDRSVSSLISIIIRDYLNQTVAKDTSSTPQ